MELSKFKEVLLKVAVCAIACDGDIDDREIEMLHKIEKESPYFSALNLSHCDLLIRRYSNFSTAHK